MRITPRKTEVEAIVKLLETDGYDSAETLAKDLINEVWAQLLERDMYALLYRFERSGLVLAWGPFASEGEAERWGGQVGMPKPAVLQSMRMRSPAAQARIDAEQRLLSSPPVCKCDHPKWTHQNDGYGGKCAQGGCRCRKYKTS